VVVLLRYGFSTGAIACRKSITYLHGSLFMLGVPTPCKQRRARARGYLLS
jgi:hypothetical protein